MNGGTCWHIEVKRHEPTTIFRGCLFFFLGLRWMNENGYSDVSSFYACGVGGAKAPITEQIGK